MAKRKRLPPARSIGRFPLTPSRRATVREWLRRARSGPEFVRRFLLLVRRQLRLALQSAGWTTARIATWLGPIRPFGTRTTSGRGFKLALQTTGEEIFQDPLAVMVPHAVQKCADLLPRWSSAYERAGNMTDRCLWYHGVGLLIRPGKGTGKSQRGKIQKARSDGIVPAESIQSLMRNLQRRDTPGAVNDETGALAITMDFLANLAKYGDSTARWIRFVGISPVYANTWEKWEHPEEA